MLKNLKSAFEFYFSNLQSNLLYLLKWVLIGSLMGCCIGFVSALFLTTLHWATETRENNFWLIYFLPLGGFIVGLIYFYFGKNLEGGNNLLIETIHQPGPKIPILMAPLVFVGTIITHLLGGSAGREGTALQMAGSIADQFSKPLKLNNDDRRTLIIAAVAGGFGSVFGTPLAGAVFALEFFLIGRIRYQSIFPAFFTAIIAHQITTLFNVPHTHYHIPFVPELTFINIIYSVLAGILFGLCASFFSRSLSKLSLFFKSTISYPPLRPVVGGIIVLILILILNTTKYIGLGIPTIVQSFQEQLSSYDFALKILFTIITLAAGFKGGEVTPLFFIGATLGNALGLIIPLPTGLLAGMGFVAVFAGATNTPLACSLMAIELFGADCAVFVFIGCIISYLFSGHTSIYNRQIIGDPKNKINQKDQGKHLNEL